MCELYQLSRFGFALSYRSCIECRWKWARWKYLTGSSTVEKCFNYFLCPSILSCYPYIQSKHWCNSIKKFSLCTWKTNLLHHCQFIWIYTTSSLCSIYAFIAAYNYREEFFAFDAPWPCCKEKVTSPIRVLFTETFMERKFFFSASIPFSFHSGLMYRSTN